MINLNQISQTIRRLNTMQNIEGNTPYVSYPFTLLNYSTFKLDQDLIAKSRFTVDSISNQSDHPWISQSKFQFECFDIKAQKTGDLLGALTHIQQQKTNPFDINIKIPSFKDYTPFANFLSQNQRPQLSFLNSQVKSSTIESYFNLDLNNMTQVKSQQQSIPPVPLPSPSLFTQIDFMQNGQLCDYSRMSLWQQTQNQGAIISSSLVYSTYVLQEVDNLNITQNYFFQREIEKVPQQQIIIQVIQALQGIEGRFLILDYQNMKWSIRPQKNFMISYYYKQSIGKYIQDVLLIADMRSKIDVALEYIRIKQSKRQLYSKILEVYTNSLQVFQCLLMGYIENPISFLQFSIRLQPIKTQIHLLLTLLIKQDCINQPFSDFSKSFLYTENEIFKLLFAKLQLNNYCEQQEKEIIKKLNLSCFQSILFSLNVFLHYNREEWESSNNRQFYFGLLFEERKEYVDKMIEKLNIISTDDLEIYNVCKETNSIRIILDYSQLIQYQEQWQALFKRKIKILKSIGRRIEKERQGRLEQIIEKKAIEIAEMKVKLMQRVQATSKLKAEQRERQRIHIEELKREIDKKIETRKLLKLIEIQKEKGYLLDVQLKEKDLLLNKKYQILAQHPELIGRRMEVEEQKKMEVEEQNISVHSSEPRSMLSLGRTQPINQPHTVRELLPPRQQSHANSLPAGYRKSKSTKQIPFVRKSSTRSLSRNVNEFNIQFQQDLQRKSHASSQDAQTLPLQILNEIDMQVPIKISLEVCVFSVIKNQVDILNQAYKTILYNKYRLDWIFQFLHSYILTSNGDPATNLLNISMDMHSLMNISYLKDYFFDQGIKQEVSNLKPIFYRSDNNPMMGSINLIQFASQKSLEVIVGLQFHNLPEILKPIFNYIHMAKYMQIFAFILRMRHCVQLLETEWKNLNTFQKQNDKRRNKIDRGMMKHLFDVRYKIQCFFNLFQNYFFIYVVQKQYKTITQTLRRKQIQNLPQIHNKFLEEIFRRGFIQPQKQIASRFKKTFILVKQFDIIVNKFCEDDIETYNRPEIQERLRKISREFMELHGILQSAIS